MGSNQDALQGAIVCLVAVVGALMNSTLDALIGIAIHNRFLLFW